MTITVTDLFCGAGGIIAGRRGVRRRARRWRPTTGRPRSTSTRPNFPDARHDCADVTQVDPRRYPRTDVLLASPECTNHSQARGVSRTPPATRACGTHPTRRRSGPGRRCGTSCRFAEQMAYDAIVVENVVEAATLGPVERVARRHGQPRLPSTGSCPTTRCTTASPSRGTGIYVVFWRTGLAPRPRARTHRPLRPLRADRVVRQAWKNGRRVGRYRQQWYWACTTCGTATDPATRPAADILDWDLPCPRIGDRTRPLAAGHPGPGPGRSPAARLGPRRHRRRRQRLRAHPRQPGPPRPHRTVAHPDLLDVARPGDPARVPGPDRARRPPPRPRPPPSHRVRQR